MEQFTQLFGQLLESQNANFQRFAEAMVAQQTKMAEHLINHTDSLSQNLARTNTVRKFPLSLDTYDGSKNLQNWIVDTDLKLEVSGIEEEEKGLWARTALKGLAKQHVEHKNLRSWEEIQAGLHERFVPQNQHIILRDRLLRLRQQGNDVSSYIHEFQMNSSLFDEETQPTETDLVFFFMKGLRNACRTHLFIAKVRTLSAAMQLALDFENSTLNANQATEMDLNALSGNFDNSFRRPFRRNYYNNNNNYNRRRYNNYDNYGQRPYGRRPQRNYFTNYNMSQQRRPQQYYRQNRQNFGQPQRNYRPQNQQNYRSQRPAQQQGPYRGPPRNNAQRNGNQQRRPQQPQQQRWVPRNNRRPQQNLHMLQNAAPQYYDEMQTPFDIRSNIGGPQAGGPAAVDSQ